MRQTHKLEPRSAVEIEPTDARVLQCPDRLRTVRELQLEHPAPTHQRGRTVAAAGNERLDDAEAVVPRWCGASRRVWSHRIALMQAAAHLPPPGFCRCSCESAMFFTVSI